MRSKLIAFVAVFASIALALACLDPTEVVLELSTDSCADFKPAEIYLGEGEIAMSTGCDPDGGRIGTLVFTPSSRGNKFVLRIQAEEKTGSCADVDGGTRGCVKAARSIGFVPHHRLRLPVVLERACVDKACDPSETCYRGQCVPNGIDPKLCVNGVCEPQADGGCPARPHTVRCAYDNQCGCPVPVCCAQGQMQGGWAFANPTDVPERCAITDALQCDPYGAFECDEAQDCVDSGMQNPVCCANAPMIAFTADAAANSRCQPASTCDSKDQILCNPKNPMCPDGGKCVPSTWVPDGYTVCQ